MSVPDDLLYLADVKHKDDTVAFVRMQMLIRSFKESIDLCVEVDEEWHHERITALSEHIDRLYKVGKIAEEAMLMLHDVLNEPPKPPKDECVFPTIMTTLGTRNHPENNK